MTPKGKVLSIEEMILVKTEREIYTMENNYKTFIKAIENLKKEESKEHCFQLIKQAQNYYSYYNQAKQLTIISQKLNGILNIPLKEDKEISEIDLNILQRLYLEFYRNLIELSCGECSKKLFIDCIKDCEYAIPDLTEEFKLDETKIGKRIVSEWLEISCKKAVKYLQSHKSLNLRIETIRESIEIYYKYKEVAYVNEEISFNEIFSEEYVSCLINIMNGNEMLLAMNITPILAQLCDKEIGGREKDNDTWNWCFKKDYKDSLPILKMKINQVKKCEKRFYAFRSVSEKLENILKRIKEDI